MNLTHCSWPQFQTISDQSASPVNSNLVNFIHCSWLQFQTSQPTVADPVPSFFLVAMDGVMQVRKKRKQLVLQLDYLKSLVRF